MSRTYEEIIENVIASTVKEFIASERMDSTLRIVIARYLALGRLSGISQEELIDFLGVSSPSVLERASYTEQEQDQVMMLLGQLSDEEIRDQEKQLA